jgi:hypothetical protein
MPPFAAAAAASSRLRKDWNAERDAERRKPTFGASSPCGFGSVSSSMVVAPPYALTSCTESPSTLGSSPAPEPDPPEPHPDPDPAPSPVWPCFPSPSAGGASFDPTALAFSAALAFSFCSLSLAARFALAACALACSAASRASSSRSRRALRSATRLARFPRPSASASCAELGSSGEAPRAPCAVSAEAFEPPLFWFWPEPASRAGAALVPAAEPVAAELKEACLPSASICCLRTGLTR